jgi:hypothetical protein
LQNVFLVDPGDVIGDRRADVFVETLASYPSTPEETYHSALVDGGAGVLMWTVAGAWPYSPGDIDGDQRKDFVTQAYYSSDGFVATRIWGVSSAGGTLWTNEFRTRHPAATCCTLKVYFGGSWDAGDVNGDGFIDGYLWQVAGFSKASEEEGIVVDGHDGDALVRSDESLYPVGASVDEGTSDLAHLRWDAPSDLVVDVLEGITSKVRTTSRVRFDIPSEPSDLDVSLRSDDVTGDGCADLLLDVYGPVETYFVALSGASGRVVWARGLSERAGGVRPVAHEDRNRAC